MSTFTELLASYNSVALHDMYITDLEREDLDRELNELLNIIGRNSSADEADLKLLQLGQFQELLSILCFQCKLTLTNYQRELVRRYDRWDDREERMRCFDEIKSETFLE